MAQERILSNLRQSARLTRSLTPLSRLNADTSSFVSTVSSSLSSVTGSRGGRDTLTKIFNKNEEGFGGLVWPDDLLSAKYYMRFDFAPYTRTDAFRVKNLKYVRNSVFLPMPENINDATVLNYNTDDLGPLFGAKLTETADFDSVGGMSQLLGAGAAAGQKYLLQGVEQIFGAGANERFGQEKGFIVNPHASVIFQGIQLKSHSFQWKMSPKNERETNNIKNIISHFKEMALPRETTTEGFMGYPNLVAPHYLMDSTENPYLPIFGPRGKETVCAITSIGVSYTPDGGSAFLRNGSPVAFLLSIELRELEIRWNKTSPKKDTGFTGTAVEWLAQQLKAGADAVKAATGD